MVAYLYNHFTGEYDVSMSHKDGEAKDVCEKLRTGLSSSKNSYFIYALTNTGKRAFLQYEKSAGYDIGYGLYFDNDEVKDFTPFSYCNQLQIPSSTSDIKAQLPKVQPLRYQERSSFSKWGKLFDALMFSGKNDQVAILVNNVTEAVDILSVLENLLPKSVLSDIGYSVADKPLKAPIYINRNEEEIQINVKLIFVIKKDGNSYEELKAECVYFDNETNKDNYNVELNGLSQAVSGLSFTSKRIINDFQSVLDGIYNKDGSVNEKKREVLSSLYKFRNAFSKEPERSARELYELYRFAVPEYVSLLEIELTQAYEYVKNNVDSISDETIKAVIDANALATEVGDKISKQQNIDDLFVKYCADKVDALSNQEEDKCIELMLGDKNCYLFDIFFRTAKSYKRVKSKQTKAFEIMARLLVKCKENRVEESQYQKVFFGTYEYVDIEKISELLDQKTRVYGEKELYDVALLFGNEGRNLIYSILLSSAYNQSSSLNKAVRLRGFEAALKELENSEIISCVADVRKKTIAAQEKYLSFTRKNFSEFAIDDIKGKKWFKSIVSKLSFVELVELDELLRDDEPYSGMINLFNERFIDRKFLIDAISKLEDKEFLSEIETVYERIKNETVTQKDDVDSILEYLNNLQTQDESSAYLKDFRCDFIDSWVDALTESQRQKILGKRVIGSFAEASDADKIAISEDIEKNSRGEVKHIRAKHDKFIFPRTLLLILLTGIILFIPAIVQGIAVDGFSITSIVTHFLAYFDFILLSVPLVALLSHHLSYTLIKGEKPRARLVKSNISAIICAVIPAIIFSLAFLVFWFLDIDLMTTMFNRLGE